MQHKKRLERLERLEPDSHLPTVLATVPKQWSEEEREAGVEREATSLGIAKPYEVCAIGTAVEGVTIQFVGDLAVLFDYVSKHGKRIGCG